MALVDMWRSNRDGVQSKSLHQMIAFAGEGRLADGNTCSNEFRALLTIVPLEVLQKYAVEALSGEAEDHGFALQDIVNELGGRLGYSVEAGLYRGRRGESGHDGLWTDLDNSHAIVAEVKTTVTYRIKLDPIGRYRDDLVRANKISKEKSSALIVVGKDNEDTADLEAQIRGSRYAWDIRLVSLAALFKMVALKNATDDPASARLLRGVLVPREYTKLDSLLDIVTFVAQDVSDEEGEEEENEEEVEDVAEPERQSREGAYVSKLNREGLRTQAKSFFLGKLKQDTKDISRTLLETHDGRVAICYAPSKAYKESNYIKYWFGLHDHQVEFLSKHSEGYIACLCTGAGILFMPWSEFSKHIDYMLESSKDKRHWRHIVLRLSKDGKLKLWLRSDAPQPQVDLTKWYSPL
jgi:hypothetical protein